jgi:pantoate--beta-alanine ligase
MRIVPTIQEMQSACRALRHAGKSLGLVPTMGALHAGHLSLVKAAKAVCDVTAASVFVNPTQFGPKEDLDKYPRTFEKDCAMLEAEGVDLVFAPSVAEMYPAGASTWVEVEGEGDRMEGASRPGHLRGVATVVSKLFHIVAPTHAFFGQKDAAQLAVLRKMVHDLNFDLVIVGCPIVRESDGLAMSSRNRYLSVEERKQALVLSRALRAASVLVAAGEMSSAPLLAGMYEVFAAEPAARIDYISVVDPDTLLPVDDIAHGAMLAVAAYIGTTRLLDNVLTKDISQKKSRSTWFEFFSHVHATPRPATFI